MFSRVRKLAVIPLIKLAITFIYSRHHMIFKRCGEAFDKGS